MKCTLCVLVLAVFSTSFAADKKRDDSCTTPDGKNGKCVSVDNCPVISNAVASRNETVFNFAKQSYCGFDKDTLVCCEQPGPVSSSKLDINEVLGNKACGVIKEQPKILGGQATDIGEFPWMVSIQYKNRKTGNTRALCGGTLINDEYVLTASACVSNEQQEPISVKLGEWDTTTDPDCKEQVANKHCADPIQTVGIKEIIQYPLHDPKNQYNDIGLIRLDKKISFTDFIQPICLSHIEPNAEVASRMTVIGWGKSENASLANVLRKVEVPVVERESCNVVYQKHNRPLGVHEFCAGGEEGKDTCSGDAGGPAMRMYSHGKVPLVWNQDGIISLGAVKCGIAGYPTIYTRVSDYLDWIANVINNSK